VVKASRELPSLIEADHTIPAGAKQEEEEAGIASLVELISDFQVKGGTTPSKFVP